MIDEAMPSKLKLEKIERDFSKSKEQIQVISQLHLDEIKEWIEAPLTSQMKIDLFLWERGMVKKREIGSLICKDELHDHDIHDLLDAFSECQYALDKS